MIHCIMIAAGVGAAIGVAAVVAVPVIIACLGFTACGIRSGSAASSMMSYSAISNGGGVPGGGVIATLQSAGTAVTCILVTAVIGALGGAVAGAIHGVHICKAVNGTEVIPVTGQGMVGTVVSATVASLFPNSTV
ncbi:hypothetical protein PO909_019670 [Leuciscus waleckii]